MSAAARSQALAADLARRAIAAAERRREEEGATEDAAERLRSIADEAGKVDVDDALDVLAGRERPTVDLFAEHRAREGAKQQAAHERLFGREPEPEQPPTKPQGDADVGKGAGPNYEYETVQTEAGPQRFRVFPLDQLQPDERNP